MGKVFSCVATLCHSVAPLLSVRFQTAHFLIFSARIFGFFVSNRKVGIFCNVMYD